MILSSQNKWLQIIQTFYISGMERVLRVGEREWEKAEKGGRKEKGGSGRREKVGGQVRKKGEKGESKKKETGGDN